jgi:uncharacterized protein (DUF433 family)
LGVGGVSVATRRAATVGRIVRDPKVLGGEPIVRGTRIPVRSIVLAWREDEDAEGVLNAYPQLTPVDVQEALAFYDTHRVQIERYIRANLAED